MNYWWTSDTHFNHGNIIKYCNRPFKDVGEMNSTMIHNVNAIVKPEDTVFFLGDFCFRNTPGGKEGEGLPEKAEVFIKQLNGHWIFVKGNHDRNNSLKTIIEKVWIRYGGYRICMVHNPIHADPTCKLNFVGHIHEKWKFKRLNNRCDLINVGVDQWDFRPITFETIMKCYSRWKRTGAGNEQTIQSN